MNIFMKNLKAKSAVNCVFMLFLALFIFSGHYLRAAAPTVVGSIPDEDAVKDELFSMSFDIYEVFSDADNDGLSVTVTKSDDSALPTWLTAGAKTLVPSIVGAYNTPGYAFGVMVVGNYAYVADHTSGLQIIDVSIPSSPNLVGAYDTFGSARGVFVVGNYAYVADYDSGLQIIDVSTPSSPSLVGTYDTSGYARGVTVVGNYAYVADYDSGLQIIDVSIPNSPSLVGAYDTPVGAKGVFVIDNYAYIADGSSGLQIIDVSTPSSPSLVGTCDTSDAQWVAVVSDYAYVADYDSGLQIIDVSTPSSPSLVGTYDTSGYALGVTTVGNYAYVADRGSGLQIIDVSVPSSPSLVVTYGTFNEAYGVTIVGNYAYVANNMLGLQIIGDIREGIQLGGTPSASDVGLLNLKATASDGVDEVSTTFSINVVNDPPIVTDVPKSGTEDTTVTFTASDFTDHFSDDNFDNLTKIQVTSLPNNGTLELSDVSVTLDQEILVGDLGNLTFDPDANWNGDTSFSWKGYDGIEYSVAAANVNITISAEQDAPTVIDVPKSGTEDTTLTFTASDFTGHFSDVDFDNLTKIQITSLPDPDHGVLKLSAVDVTLDQEILVGDLGNLTFDPEANWNGDTSFSWKGSDGIEYSAAAANVNITISAEQDAPTVSDVSKSGTEDTTLTFTASDFTGHFSDVDFDNLTKIQITSLPDPDHGVLKLSAVDVTLDQEILVGDLGNLTFDPDANWNGDTSFAWKGYDGIEYSAAAANVNITISAEQDAPTVSDVSKSGTEDTTLTFTASDFTGHFSDVDFDNLTKIQVTSLPDNGTLKLSDVDVTLDQEILVGDLGNLTFEPDANWNGDTSFTWKGNDGVEYSATAANVNITISTEQDAPTVSDVTKSGTEDTTLTFTASDFTDHFSDVDFDNLTKIQVTSLPDNGTLKFSDVDVTLDQEILVGDLGNLTFEPDANWNGDTSFAWKGYDGIEYSAAAANVNITISAENDPPIVSDVTKSGSEGALVTFTAEDFTSHFSDIDGDDLTKIQITSLPANGTLKLSGVDVTLDQEILVGDLGNLTFEPDANWNGDTSFAWKGYDGTEYSVDVANVNIQITDIVEDSAFTYSSKWWML